MRCFLRVPISITSIDLCLVQSANVALSFQRGKKKRNMLNEQQQRRFVLQVVHSRTTFLIVTHINYRTLHNWVGVIVTHSIAKSIKAKQGARTHRNVHMKGWILQSGIGNSKNAHFKQLVLHVLNNNCGQCRYGSKSGRGTCFSGYEV